MDGGEVCELLAYPAGEGPGFTRPYVKEAGLEQALMRARTASTAWIPACRLNNGQAPERQYDSPYVSCHYASSLLTCKDPRTTSTPITSSIRWNVTVWTRCSLWWGPCRLVRHQMMWLGWLACPAVCSMSFMREPRRELITYCTPVDPHHNHHRRRSHHYYQHQHCHHHCSLAPRCQGPERPTLVRTSHARPHRACDDAGLGDFNELGVVLCTA